MAHKTCLYGPITNVSWPMVRRNVILTAQSLDVCLGKGVAGKEAVSDLGS